MTLDIDHLRSWIGRTMVTEDRVTPVPLRALAATLDRDDVRAAHGEPIAPCWHWLYFLPPHRQSALAQDGHAERGGFLPPVPLPRRMWAGSQIDFQRPIRVGDAIVSHSCIEDVRLKEGRTGPLVFVKLRNEIQAEGRQALIERHDIVYRSLPRPGEPVPVATPSPVEAQWTRQVVPSEVLLFRYSALTFNAHRIHLDRRYTTDVEGYPGLVVHGPLIATLLLDLLRRQLPQARVERFEFRAIRPVFDTAPFEICGRVEAERQVKLWARTAEGNVALEATASLA